MKIATDQTEVRWLRHWIHLSNRDYKAILAVFGVKKKWGCERILMNHRGLMVWISRSMISTEVMSRSDSAPNYPVLTTRVVFHRCYRSFHKFWKQNRLKPVMMSSKIRPSYWINLIMSFERSKGSQSQTSPVIQIHVLMGCLWQSSSISNKFVAMHKVIIPKCRKIGLPLQWASC